MPTEIISFKNPPQCDYHGNCKKRLVKESKRKIKRRWSTKPTHPFPVFSSQVVLLEAQVKFSSACPSLSYTTTHNTKSRLRTVGGTRHTAGNIPALEERERERASGRPTTLLYAGTHTHTRGPRRAMALYGMEQPEKALYFGAGAGPCRGYMASRHC